MERKESMKDVQSVVDSTQNSPQTNREEAMKTKLGKKMGECLSKFYDLMNEKAEALGMKMSNFAVAHGMHHDNNYSTALDIGRLSCHAMKSELL